MRQVFIFGVGAMALLGSALSVSAWDYNDCKAECGRRTPPGMSKEQCVVDRCSALRNGKTMTCSNNPGKNDASRRKCTFDK